MTNPPNKMTSQHNPHGGDASTIATRLGISELLGHDLYLILALGKLLGYVTIS